VKPVGYSVLIRDMFHRYREEEEYVIGDFPTLELAKEFARRRVRDSVEEHRQPGQSNEELRRMWYAFGEDAVVLGETVYVGSRELDFFIEHPATAEERDWQAVKRLAGIG
jgi:hypothetical protein